MLEYISIPALPPEIIQILKDAAGPMLGRAAGTVVGKHFGVFLKDLKEAKIAEQTCVWAFQEWLLALITTFQERGKDEQYIQQFFVGYAMSMERFFEDEPVTAELLRPFTGSVDKPVLDHGLLIKRWRALDLPKLPSDFDAARACRWYVDALNTKRQAFELLRGHWQAQAAERRNNLLEQMRGPWADWDLDQYARAMRRFYQALDIATLEMTESQELESQPIHLKDVFIAQDARRSRPRRTLPRDYLEKQRKVKPRAEEKTEVDTLERVLGDDAGLDQHWERTQREPIFDILISGDIHHLVVLGDPGAGKSCLVRHIALSLLEGFGDDAASGGPIRTWVEKLYGHLPLLIELRKFVTWEEKDGKHGFLGYLHYLGCEHGFGLNEADLSIRLKDKASLVMFDGLDEIIDPKERGRVADQISGFAGIYPAAKIVVTSRIAGFDQRPFVQRASGFTIVTLDDLSPEQIERFSQTWFRLTLKGNATAAWERHQHLVNSVQTRPQLATLAGNPLLLTILAIVARGRELPAERAKLYDHALRVFCHQWDFRRHVELLEDSPLKDLEEDDKLELLRRIAWSMLEGDGLRANVIDKNRLEAASCAYFKAEWWTGDITRCKLASRQMIDVLQTRNYVLCQQGAGRLYGFVHRTFLEYLAAAQLCWRVEKDRDLDIDSLCASYVVPNAADDSWREIIRLLVAQLQPKDAARILDALVNVRIDRWRPHPGGTPALVLAIECLAELRPKDRRHAKSAMEAIIGRASEDSSPMVRRASISALGQQLGGDPEIRTMLIAWAQSDNDAHVCRASIAALGRQLGSDPEIRTMLITWAQRDNDADVRHASISALGRQLGGDPEIRTMLIERAQTDDNAGVRSFVTNYWVKEFGDRTASVLLSRDSDELDPWLDPQGQVDDGRVTAAAKRLAITEAEVRSRYEAIATQLPLRLVWKEGAAS